MENSSKANTPAVQGGAKKNTGLIILTILLGIGTVGFGTAFLIKMLDGNSAEQIKEDCIVSKDDVENPDDGSAAAAVAEYEQDKEVKKIVKEITNELRGSGKPAVASVYDMSYPVVKIKDGPWTSASKAYGVYSLDDIAKIDDYSSIAGSYFAKNGFSKDDGMSADGMSATYRKGEIVCTQSIGASPYTLGCAYDSWVSKEKAELVTALSIAYENAGKKFGDNVINADPANISSSPDGKYETISASITSKAGISGSAGLFYRLKDGGEWIYVTSTQNVPDCSDFTGDAKEAFFGTTCGGAGGTKRLGD